MSWGYWALDAVEKTGSFTGYSSFSSKYVGT
ncbi:Protein of unknown function [Lactobacillus gigeriorum DSM 23908 = CRBIP 24.85]|uniref:Uncharacterized protein n=1 Tax=Lactobacillus gigeriorum DSM 23908 = CRBIP 24.85 TaxID=1423751 RepID=I7LDT5_9LACO|nr:Protein of unknown function [Lactobacillus gigeriorum DSM 23908 = CRBIP 24.85]